MVLKTQVTRETPVTSPPALSLNDLQRPEAKPPLVSGLFQPEKELCNHDPCSGFPAQCQESQVAKGAKGAQGATKSYKDLPETVVQGCEQDSQRQVMFLAGIL